MLAALSKIGGAGAKRDLARELGIGPDDKKLLRKILRELEGEGALGRTGRRKFASAEALPPTGVIDIVDRDADGELIGRLRGEDGYFGPHIRLAPGDKRARRAARRRSASATACWRASLKPQTAPKRA